MSILRPPRICPSSGPHVSWQLSELPGRCARSMVDGATIGQRAARVRKLRGLSQTQLAAAWYGAASSRPI